MQTFEEHKRELVAHYARMAAMPGAVDHARYRVRELAKEPGLSDIAELVRVELERLKAASLAQ